MRLSDRELATVLASLRYWQAETLLNDEGDPQEPIPIIDAAGHFSVHKPLSVDEIDDLCERLNCPDGKSPIPALLKLETALEFYPHWKPEMVPLLLSIVRAAIPQAEAKGGDPA